MSLVSRRNVWWSVVVLGACLAGARRAEAEGAWETTGESERALARGLQWLARNQGPEGNWKTNELGLVSMGALAFLSAGHTPDKGPYGDVSHRALEYVISQAAKKRSGLLNIADAQHDMYNHGLSTFVLGQAYGMSNDPRLARTLDRALKLIVQTQCRDGGWDYRAERQDNGHDLSLAVMQAKALRSAVDSGFEIPPDTIDMAIQSVRRHYTPKGCPLNADESEQRKFPGQFTYGVGGGNITVAMAAAGVVCMQEFAQYDDWRIEKSMEVIEAAIRKDVKIENKRAPFDAYTLYYVGQALYQVGGERWKSLYPLLREAIVAGQVRGDRPDVDGKWNGGQWVGGEAGDVYMTSVCCFVLAMPNRYLPILQEGKINSLRERFNREP
jgi:hypothetical protein